MDDEQEPGRDPFAPSEMMRTITGAPSGFVPSDQPRSLPGLFLKGYVEDEEGTTCALLGVEGAATYLVRKEDTISLPRGAQNLVMRIVDVTSLELRVEIGELRRVVVVR